MFHTKEDKQTISPRIYYTDYTDDLELLTSITAQAKPLKHSLEQASTSVSLYVTAIKTEFMSFEIEGAISTLSGKPIKLVEQFTYFGNNISSAESDISMQRCGML